MYSNTLRLSTDLRFNLNPNFRMSLKSFRYPSNSTSFRSPQFTKMPGTGGTGAYGDVSDGQMYLIMKHVGWGNGTLVLEPADLKEIRANNIGRSLHMVYGAACATSYFLIDGVKYNIGRTGESAYIGTIDPNWLYSTTKNCTIKMELVSPWGSCTNPGSGVGFVSARQVKGWKRATNKRGAQFSPAFYKISPLSKATNKYAVFGEEFANPTHFWW